MDTERDVVTELPELDCWELLRSQEFGRLAFHLANEVHIVPINYLVRDETLVFRTAEGSKLLGITMNQDVAFEIDHYSDDRATSVVIRGKARELEGEEADIAEQLPLRPWVPTDKFNIVVIEPTEVTGRSFRLDRPPRHWRPAS
jgi:nitroimidazol reductase NimA-like FMN-containing flavoprotein (pyridoxamine 5'-phosphate oxidase superfamily)